MTALFPYLPGLTWPVGRSVGQWDTTRQVSVSGKETHFANRTQARYAYTLDVEALDANGSRAALVAYSKQALEAMFNATFGGALIFNFWDADDSAVVGQPFGTGDGATTTFQLYRTTAGGWSDAVFAPVIAGSAPVQVQAGTGGAWAPNNMAAWSSDLTNAAWTKTSSTVTSGVSDPFGGSTAFTLTATAANGYVSQFDAATVGLPSLVFSVWVRRRTGSGAVQFYNDDTGGWTNVALTSSWRRLSVSNGLGVYSGIGVNLTTSGDAVDLYGPQIEANASGSPGAYIATAAAPAYGSPILYANGTVIATSAYTLSSSGLVTFTAAPSSGVALTWSGSYWWPCNFDDDTLSMSKFMGGLWEAKAIKFTTRIF